MPDWSTLAGIVALVTIPIYASPLVLQPAFSKLQHITSELYYRNNKCKAHRWHDLPSDPIPPAVLRRSSSAWTMNRQADEGGDDQSSKNLRITHFIQSAWQCRTYPTSRPPYLDIAKEYLLLDADVLLIITQLDEGWGSTSRQPDPGTRCSLHLGSTEAQFLVFEGEYGFYLVGKVSALPRFEPLRPKYEGITKADIRAVASGYPPFYRQSIHTHSGVEIAHPIQGMRDIIRPGWLIAIGFSVHQPLRLYNKQHLPDYLKACDRLLGCLERLQREYSWEAGPAKLLDVAVRVVTRMNGFATGSGAESITRGTVLLSGGQKPIGYSLRAPEIMFAFDLFNDFRDDGLSTTERERLSPMLEDVLRAAVHGVYTWWQYVNNEGREIPGWLLDDRVRMNPIWLEDGKGPSG